MNFGLIGKQSAIGGGLVGIGMIIITVLGLIPVIGCFIGLLNWVLGCMPGVVAAYLIEKETGRISIGEGAVAGCIAAVIAGIMSGIVTVIAMTFFVGASTMGASEMGGMAGGAAMGAGIGIVSVLIGVVVMVVINAGTGAVYALIKNR